jgi:8-oxo-dGTP diphosphatase
MQGAGGSLLGGEVEKGESLVDGAVLEAKEEAGLTIEESTIVAVNEKFREDIGVHAVFFTFTAKVIGGTIAIIDDLEISEI